MVISDEPGIVWRAGRRTPDRYVDTSILRITSPRDDIRITEDDVVRDAASPRVCGVVRWSAVRFGSFADLGARLRKEGYVRTFAAPGSSRALWIKASVPSARATSGGVARPQPVEPAQRRDPVDHPTERHELRRQVERDQRR